MLPIDGDTTTVRHHLLTSLAVARVRRKADVQPNPGRWVCHEKQFGYFARCFANIYLLIDVFEGPFSELHVESAVVHALPSIEALVLAWALMLIGGVFFPFRRKELFEKTPWVGKTILGLPYMSVACGVSAMGMIFCLVILILDPVAAGHDPVQLAIVGVVIAAGLVFYFVMKAIRSAQGVDIDQAFKEIPVE